jgi:hypothetical protein
MWRVLILGSLVLRAGLAASGTFACSAVVETGIVVNRLKGHITFEGNVRPGMSVQLQRVTKHRKEVIRTAIAEANGDFVIGDIPEGDAFRLVIELDGHSAVVLPIDVLHVKRKGTLPTTFLEFDLHRGFARDCDYGKWTFHSFLDAGDRTQD